MERDRAVGLVEEDERKRVHHNSHSLDEMQQQFLSGKRAYEHAIVRGHGHSQSQRSHQWVADLLSRKSILNLRGSGLRVVERGCGVMERGSGLPNLEPNHNCYFTSASARTWYLSS
ncbi:hypothetical protein EVAR_83928_1 [Eumeta japonica]|uniref:Uncharacterized protein n=1 Tax=Eumeta variegata TaxID=151549 RepID=A0A4C1XRK0_EUMVA|nr:hypothetical protein EVAR_83928_1 [Eumeta japonica]